MKKQPANIRLLGKARLRAIGGTEALVAFLEETLIPDLLESGREATAEDFAAACCAIRRQDRELQAARFNPHEKIF